MNFLKKLFSRSKKLSDPCGCDRGVGQAEAIKILVSTSLYRVDRQDRDGPLRTEFDEKRNRWSASSRRNITGYGRDEEAAVKDYLDTRLRQERRKGHNRPLSAYEGGHEKPLSDYAPGEIIVWWEEREMSWKAKYNDPEIHAYSAADRRDWAVENLIECRAKWEKGGRKGSQHIHSSIPLYDESELEEQRKKWQGDGDEGLGICIPPGGSATFTIGCDLSASVVVQDGKPNEES